MALLWKYGGVYSDLDTVTLKSFEPLLRSKTNGVGYAYELYDSVNNGVLVFQHHHWFLTLAMEKFVQNYNPYIWAANGPWLILDLLKTYCSNNENNAYIFSNIFAKLMKLKSPFNETEFRFISSTNSSSNNSDAFSKCNDLFIYPESYFYPYRTYLYEFWKLFKKNGADDMSLWEKLNNSFSLHYFGFMSSKMKVNVNDNSVLAKIAQKYCPVTFDYVKRRDLNFE
jgi:mannosyltransferase OCH1-like enzyme